MSAVMRPRSWRRQRTSSSDLRLAAGASRLVIGTHAIPFEDRICTSLEQAVAACIRLAQGRVHAEAQSE